MLINLRAGPTVLSTRYYLSEAGGAEADELATRLAWPFMNSAYRLAIGSATRVISGVGRFMKRTEHRVSQQFLVGPCPLEGGC